MVVAFAFGASVHGSSTSYRRTVCLLQDESVRFACEELQGNPSSGFIQASNAREEKRHKDRKSTRLNSSHLVISYAVFCLKKKKKEVPADAIIELERNEFNRDLVGVLQ